MCASGGEGGDGGDGGGDGDGIYFALDKMRLLMNA